jgi:SAM-dependent methyltransferase
MQNLLVSEPPDSDRADLRATCGFSSPEAYERGRPPFPAMALADVATHIGLTPESKVLDLAAGTGKLTRVLVPIVGRVIAVEPSEAMLAAFHRNLPAVEAHAGVAEAIPLADRSVEAVFVADAFHWFRTAEAAAEIARILAPGGHLVLVSHRPQWWQRDDFSWVKEFDRILEPFWEMSRGLAGEHPNITKRWKIELDEVGLFEPFSTREVEVIHSVRGDDFLALIASWTWIAILPKEQRDVALSQVRELVGPHSQLTLTYRTEIQHARVR